MHCAICMASAGPGAPTHDRPSRAAGFLLRRGFNSCQRRRIPVGLAGQHDIEQKRWNAGICKMSRDTRAHGPGAQDRNTLDELHRGSLPRKNDGA